MFLFNSNKLLSNLLKVNYLKTFFRLSSHEIVERNGHLEEDFQEINVNSFEELITNEKTKEKIELIISEYEYEKYTTLRVPNTLTTDHMKDLLTVDDPNDRKKLINFLFTKQLMRKKSKDKRKQISDKYWTEKNEIYSKMDCNRTGIWDNNNQLVYGLWHNTLFSKIMKSSVSCLYNNRLRRAALFGQKLVIDLGFDRYMKLSEKRLLLKQLNLSYNYNKYKTKDPFDLHLTNCDPNSLLMQEMPKHFQNINSPQLMVQFHTQSYLDLFPRHRLLYLSPHSRHTLQEVDEDMIFIIGGLIDKSFHQPITYVSAEKAGIPSARLPIDDNMLWKSGTKSLCLNHIIAILDDYKMCGDWRVALTRNVPKRKQKTPEQVQYEDLLREQKRKRFLKNKSKINVF